MDGLKDMLKCANCQRFLFPPILQCVNGHMECRLCFDMKPQCGKCHQKMVDVPAKFAEMITEQFNVQCTYAEKGCTESVAYKVCNSLETVSSCQLAGLLDLVSKTRTCGWLTKFVVTFRTVGNMRRFVPSSQCNVPNLIVRKRGR